MEDANTISSRTRRSGALHSPIPRCVFSVPRTWLAVGAVAPAVAVLAPSVDVRLGDAVTVALPVATLLSDGEEESVAKLAIVIDVVPGGVLLTDEAFRVIVAVSLCDCDAVTLSGEMLGLCDSVDDAVGVTDWLNVKEMSPMRSSVTSAVSSATAASRLRPAPRRIAPVRRVMAPRATIVPTVVDASPMVAYACNAQKMWEACGRREQCDIRKLRCYATATRLSAIGELHGSVGGYLKIP